MTVVSFGSTSTSAPARTCAATRNDGNSAMIPSPASVESTMNPR